MPPLHRHLTSQHPPPEISCPIPPDPGAPCPQNFKGATGGAIFRCYPGPYQIYSRTAAGFSLVEERQEMPSLKEVSLEVLPRAAAKAASAAKR
jgi:hypothetical protein